MSQLVEALRHKCEVSGAIPGRVLGNFQIKFKFKFSIPSLRIQYPFGSIQIRTEMSTKKFLWG